MVCKVCEGVDLEHKCSECGRLPKDLQLAILSEAHDILKHRSISESEVFDVLKILTGVVTRLVKDTRHLRHAPFGLRKGLPRHHPNCSIHSPPHDHCDCIINRQPIHSR